MRLFASWWERIPVRAAAPKLVAALAVVGMLSHVSAAQHLTGASGWIWG